MRARLGTLAVGTLLAASCGGEGEGAPTAAAHASSHAVAHLQEELSDLGYYDGPHDGLFGDDTHRALKELQSDEGLEDSGKLDRPTRAVLGALAGKSDALSLKAVQSALTELGLYTGPIDGDYGAGTEAALEDVQREAGIEVDGAFGPETAAALNELYEAHVAETKPVEEVGDTSADQGDGLLKQGDHSDAVKQLQQRLAELGFRPGAADGVFGAETASAVMAFEKQEGLGRDGVAGPQVQARLESPEGKGPRDGGLTPRIEVDLDRQIAFVIARDGKVTIVNVSTGSGETYEQPGGGTAVAFTPTGSFSVYRKEEGIVEAPLGSLYKPLYFDEGWAVHGAASVPGYPASHGCVRTSDVDQDFVSQTIPQGAAVIIRGTSRGEPGSAQPGF